MAHSKLAILDKIIAEMLTQDVIEPSDSEWNFHLILVPIPDRLPLPVKSDILHSLGPRDRKQIF